MSALRLAPRPLHRGGRVLSGTRAQHVDNLARTLWGEARGEGRAGMEAVASVIMERVRDPRRWPHDVTGVVRQPLQFSAWNANDVNRPQLLRANHFHTHRVSPAWSRGVTPSAIIGNHRFFRL